MIAYLSNVKGWWEPFIGSINWHQCPYQDNIELISMNYQLHPLLKASDSFTAVVEFYEKNSQIYFEGYTAIERRIYCKDFELTFD